MIIEIDLLSGVPPARQIADGIALRALSGALAPDSPLPAVPELALQLQVNPNIVTGAYELLRTEGIMARADPPRIARRLPESSAAIEPIARALAAVIERARRAGLSPDAIERIFRDVEGEHHGRA